MPDRAGVAEPDGQAVLPAAAVVYSAAVRPASAQAVRAVGVDVERLHVAQVEDDAAVGRAVAGAAVAAAADGELEAGLAGERDGARHVGVVRGRTITAGRGSRRRA